MSALDIILLAAGAYFVVRGLMRGFTSEMFSLLGIIGSFYCSMTLSAPLSHFLSSNLHINPLINTTVSIVVIFLAVLFCCEIAGRQLKKLLKKTSLSKIDTLLGGVTGFLKFSVIILTLLIIAVIIVPLTGNGWVRNSKVLTVAAHILPVVYPPLEERGLVPNIDDLRREAIDFISRQSLRELTGDKTSAKDKEPPPETSEDIAPAEETAAGGEKRRSPMDDLAGKLGLSPDSEEKSKSAGKTYRETALEFLLGSDREDSKKTNTTKKSEPE